MRDRTAYNETSKSDIRTARHVLQKAHMSVTTLRILCMIAEGRPGLSQLGGVWCLKDSSNSKLPGVIFLGHTRAEAVREMNEIAAVGKDLGLLPEDQKLFF